MGVGEMGVGETGVGETGIPHLNRLGCVGPVGVPKNVFLAVVAGNVTT